MLSKFSEALGPDEEEQAVGTQFHNCGTNSFSISFVRNDEREKHTLLVFFYIQLQVSFKRLAKMWAKVGKRFPGSQELSNVAKEMDIDTLE